MRAYSRLSLCGPGTVPAVTLAADPSSGDNRGTAVGTPVGSAVADSVVGGRWLWTSGRLAETHLGVFSGEDIRAGASGWISWDVQAANAAPSLLLWQQRQAQGGQAVGRELGLGPGQGLEAVGVTAVLSGLYR